MGLREDLEEIYNRKDPPVEITDDSDFSAFADDPDVDFGPADDEDDFDDDDLDDEDLDYEPADLGDEPF